MRANKVAKGDGISYSVVHTSYLRDMNLSLQEKGLLSWMLIQPDNWNFTVAGTASVHGVSKNTVQKVLNKLIECGYMKRKRIYQGGRVKGCEYVVSDISLDDQYKPLLDTGFQNLKNQDLISQSDYLISSELISCDDISINQNHEYNYYNAISDCKNDDDSIDGLQEKLDKIGFKHLKREFPDISEHIKQITINGDLPDELDYKSIRSAILYVKSRGYKVTSPIPYWTAVLKQAATQPVQESNTSSQDEIKSKIRKSLDKNGFDKLFLGGERELDRYDDSLLTEVQTILQGLYSQIYSGKSVSVKGVSGEQLRVRLEHLNEQDILYCIYGLRNAPEIRNRIGYIQTILINAHAQYMHSELDMDEIYPINQDYEPDDECSDFDAFDEFEAGESEPVVEESQVPDADEPSPPIDFQAWMRQTFGERAEQDEPESEQKTSEHTSLEDFELSDAERKRRVLQALYQA